jgi:hypothetical protein
VQRSRSRDRFGRLSGRSECGGWRQQKACKEERKGSKNGPCICRSEQEGLEPGRTGREKNGVGAAAAGQIRSDEVWSEAESTHGGAHDHS